MKNPIPNFALLLLATALPASAQWSTATMPEIRSEFTATTTDQKLYIAGGRGHWSVLESIDVLDIATGTWTQLRLSSPRYELAAASVGHEVFFGGGLTWLGTAGGFVGTVDIYNELTGSWSTEQLPLPAGLFGAGSFGTKVYFAGGFQAIIQVFDTVTRTWTVLRPPGPNRGFLKVLADERWVCMGRGGGVIPAQHLIDVYDSWSDSWTQVFAPEKVHSMALSEGRLQVTGCDNGLPEHAIWEYELESGVWSSRRRSSDRCFPASGAIGPFMVLANGLLPGNAIYPDAEVYNRLTDDWQSTLLSVAARSRVTAVHEPSGSIFVIGGQLNGSTSTSIDNIDIFRVDTSIGTPFCSPPSPNSSGDRARIEAAGLVASEDNWFFLGMNGAPPGRVAMFLAGSQAAIATNPAGSQGSLCLGGAVVRLTGTVGVIRADGSYGSRVDLSLPTLPMQTIGIGETWHFQAWFRDANPGPTTNFTDALSVTFE